MLHPIIRSAKWTASLMTRSDSSTVRRLPNSIPTLLRAATNYILEADLPGFEKGDVKLDVKDDILTIKAERHTETEKKDKDSRSICCERSYGSYSRQFDVSGIDTDKISAKYENGVLKLTMPKKEAPKETSKHLEIG